MSGETHTVSSRWNPLEVPCRSYELCVSIPLCLCLSHFSWFVSSVNSSSHQGKRSSRAAFAGRQTLLIRHPLPFIHLSLAQKPDSRLPLSLCVNSLFKVFSVHVTWRNEKGSLLCKIMFNSASLSQAAVLSFHPLHKKLTHTYIDVAWGGGEETQHNDVTAWELSNYKLRWYSY